MVNGFDPSAPRFLADLGRIQDRLQRAERQISSGLRVETASDAPEQVVQILRLRSRVDSNTQVQTNLTRVRAQVDTAEAAMRESVALLERAKVLAAQTASTGAPNRTAMATEARQLHDRLIALAGSAAEGQFVFGGDGATNPPYVADATQPSGVRFAGASAVSSSLVADENHTTFAVSKTASQLFDAAGPDNAFRALNDLATALSHDSESEVQAAMPGIASALDHLNRQLAFYGNAQNRVTAAFDAAKRNAVSLQKDLSELQETDLPAAILELNSAKLQHETALSAHAQMPKRTLFDYMG
jgi:flagellar hook-associated protein 3 FlgL